VAVRTKTERSAAATHTWSSATGSSAGGHVNLALEGTAFDRQEALTGAEFALAIPGSLGGAVWANAGAHGTEIADILETVDLVTADGTEAQLPASALGFGYRDSRLKHPAAGALGDVVISASLRLSPEDPEVVAIRLDEIRRWRREHQPLGIPSAGSVFRNPEGDSAGRLIDAAGLKGRRIGGAVVSEKHANWILNDRKGTATDVRDLADIVHAVVLDRFGVDLVPEVEFVGDWPDAADRPDGQASGVAGPAGGGG